MFKRKIPFKPKHVVKPSKHFKVFAKSKHGLKLIVEKSKKLKGVMNKIFSKKGLAVAAVGGAIGIGIDSVWNYIDSNTGCFKKNVDGSVCKYRELSCCHKTQSNEIPLCDGAQAMKNICDDYDEDNEQQSCCKLCSCEFLNCLPTETMECQKPTVGDALNAFTQNVG